MVRTQVQLTEAQAAALKRVAAARGCSLAQLIREGVDRLLAGEESSVESLRARATRTRAAALSGQFRSGLRDLSTEHDRYLASDDDW